MQQRHDRPVSDTDSLVPVLQAMKLRCKEAKELAQDEEIVFKLGSLLGLSDFRCPVDTVKGK